MLPQNTILGRVEGVEVYEYFDGPKAFLAESDLGVQYLVDWIGVTPDFELEWLYVAITTNRLNELKRNEIDYYTVFAKPESDLYFVTTSAKGDKVTLLDVETMGKNKFPPPGYYIEHIALWE